MIDLIRGYLKFLIPESLLDKNKRNSFLTLIFISLIMLIIEYFGWQGPFRYFGREISFVKKDFKNFSFYAQLYTSLSFLIFFFFIPLLLNKLFPLKEGNNTGLSGFNIRAALRLYLPLVLFMLPIVFIATSNPSFYNFYPLYKPQTLKMLLLYELVYATQFIGIEYFFRGFGLFRLEKVMPGYAIAIMVIPYSLVHIHKPFGEAIGSIFAGLILGKLALKTGSIWPGVCTHIIIALSADLFSLYHSGTLPN